MKFIIWTKGDSSVGIQGERTEVDIDVESYDERDRPEFIAVCKRELSKAFSTIWDESALVMTEEEANDEY